MLDLFFLQSKYTFGFDFSINMVWTGLGSTLHLPLNGSLSENAYTAESNP